MKIPQLVGITGLPRSGKDSVAQFLIAEHGGYRYAFADPIVNMLNAGFQQDFNSDYWVQRKEDQIPIIGKSPRELRQLLGTEWGRKLIHIDLWVSLALGEFIKNGPGMVIPDVRFPNEAKFVRERGVLIHVDGPRGVASNDHESNEPLAKLTSDLLIVNDGSLADLQYKVTGLFE